MVKHHGESSKIGQAGSLLQVATGGLQVQTCSQVAGAAHEERGSGQVKREVGCSTRAEAPFGASIKKKSHKERLTSLEELYQGQRRLLGVESSQEEAKSV
ncbi:hypothetical protein B296_00022035 [Ensete ventricosum]|uniref:Uncharacterized protein n=1 Tax=Ensete ventricosum TaxID=4639 RepID=A0A426XWU3_ENSVE|nr:hypothetical protein B296_00022035 [Ensete ventricosum]